MTRPPLGVSVQESNAVKTAKFVDQGEATAFAAVSKVLVLAVTDRWRQGKLVTLIEETDGPFQVVVAALVQHG